MSSRLQKAGSIIKNLEAVVQKFLEFARVSEAVVQKCYVKIHRTCKKKSEMESIFEHSYRSKVFSNKFLKNILKTPIHKNHIHSSLSEISI